METQSHNPSFDEIKQLFKESIDKASSASDLFEIFVQKVYQKGWSDGVKRGIKTTYDYIELFNQKSKYLITSTESYS